MKTVNNFEELLEYVNRLGIVNPTLPIGWRQAVLMSIVGGVEAAGGEYPLTVRYQRARSSGALYQWFTVNGQETALKYSFYEGEYRPA